MSPPPSPTVILYDGECGLCDRLVRFVLPRDKERRFQFAALQSPWAQQALHRHGLPTTDFESMVLLEHGQVFLQSSAALGVLSGLPRWRWTRAFVVVPPPLRDAVYGWIAKRRKRWFRSPTQCDRPQPEWSDRFLF